MFNNNYGDGMKNISIWKDTVKHKKFKVLDGNLETDILIIGGGITGVSNYYFLKKNNFNVVLVEQNEIGMSVTSNSTGKLSFLQNDLLSNIRDNLGEEVASSYLKSQIEAINLVVKIIRKEKINCDLVKTKSMVYTNDDSKIKEMEELREFLKRNNIDVYNDECSLVNSKYTVSVNNTYLFHPIKFVYGLLKDNSDVYEHTGIKKIKMKNDLYYCYTDKYVIKAKYVIIASHYPYFNIPFMFPLKASLEKSYLSASKYSTNTLSCISYSNPFVSLRTYNDYLIYLSNSHALNNDLSDKKHFNELKKKLKDLNLIPEYLWSNIDIMTNDGLPYIGEIDNKMFIATGYNTWGLASSVLSGKVIASILLKEDNPYIDLFDPRRVNIDQVIKGVKSIYQSINGFIKGYAYTNDKVQEKGKTYLYSNNQVLKKCPHLKCKLLFNEIEETWDCPCHGSRFDVTGKCISGPSNQDIKILKDDV